MSVTIKIPEGSRIRKPVARFSAPFAFGNYDFTLDANKNHFLMNLTNDSVYLIEARNFGCNLKEGVWLEGQLTKDDFPRFILSRKLKPGISIYPEPERCLNYLDDAKEITYFKTDQKDDELLITFIGKVKQTASMNLAANLITFVSLVIYQINELAWIDWFNSPYRKIHPTGIYQK